MERKIRPGRTCVESPYRYCGGGINLPWGEGTTCPDKQGSPKQAYAESVNMKKLSLTINVKVHAEFRSLEWIKALLGLGVSNT